MSIIQHLSRLFVICCAISFTPAVLAQPAGAEGDFFIHRIQPNDTLSALANRYTKKTSNWTVLQQQNAIANPSGLPIGFELKIPFPLIPEVPASATAIHVSGNASINGTPLRAGMTVLEGSTISIGTGAFVTLQLIDGTKVSLPQGNNTHIERLRQFEGLTLTDSIVQIEKGDIESHVAPSGEGVGRFEVRTPIAIIGVRGTRFRIHADSETLRSEILQGAVGLKSSSDQHSDKPKVSITAGYGAAVSADGTINLQPLLPAPVLGAVQRTASGKWTSPITPAPNAVAYLVQVANDPDGLEIISSQRFDNADIQFFAPRPGTYYALVRAIDASGLGSDHTMVSFTGSNALNSVSGTPIVLSDGSPVTLTDY